MANSSPPAGDAESSSGLWPAIRKLFDAEGGERSLRAQLEEAIDEHEGESGSEDAEDTAAGPFAVGYRSSSRNRKPPDGGDVHWVSATAAMVRSQTRPDVAALACQASTMPDSEKPLLPNHCRK